MISHARLAELCRAAYQPPYTFARGDVRANLVHEDGAAIIAFQGTSNIQQAERDLMAIPFHDPIIGTVHQGFMMGAYFVALDIVHKLDDVDLVLTGHSLGGAEALVLAALLAETKWARAKVVTFGAPRAGAADFCDKLKELDVTQYRFGNDIVPEVPRLLAWCHPRELVTIGKPLRSILNAEDHHIDNYVGALSEATAA